MRHPVLAAFLIVLALLPISAIADDWLVTKLRGPVDAHLSGAWTPVERGDVLPDGTEIRTRAGGRIALTRGRETVELLPNSLAIIRDRDGQRFTIVEQYYGAVEVEAEVRNVRHFAVRTPFLAAVVKGTHFTVRVSRTGSKVEVDRGQVAVSSKSGLSALVTKGQSARVDGDGDLTVAGAGDLPAVLDRNGKAVGFSSGANAHGQATAAAAKAANEAKSNAGGNGNGHANGNNGNNGNGNSGH
ncbi:MAG: FecR domain-containing protein [Devosia sp.]|nr:FecR domain-containing protein [Devosia sp.]